MAKYDRYILDYKTKEEKGTVAARLEVLVEENDDPQTVLSLAENELELRIVNLQRLADID